MIDITNLPGARIVDERDIPPAMLEAIKGAGHLEAFAADDLPAGFEAIFGAGPGVTILRLEAPKPIPTKKPLGIRELVAKVEAAARDQSEQREAGVDPAASGTDDALLAALLELAATPAGRASEVRAKTRCLRDGATAATCGPIGLEMIDAAIALDGVDWGRSKMGH